MSCFFRRKNIRDISLHLFVAFIWDQTSIGLFRTKSVEIKNTNHICLWRKVYKKYSTFIVPNMGLIPIPINLILNQDWQHLFICSFDSSAANMIQRRSFSFFAISLLKLASSSLSLPKRCTKSSSWISNQIGFKIGHNTQLWVTPISVLCSVVLKKNTF